MAAINSKKLLPSGKDNKEVYLVPTKNIIPSTPRLEGVKSDKEKKPKRLFNLSKKIIKVSDLFNNRLLLSKKRRETERKESERKEFEERESRLEAKDLGKKGIQENLISKIPGSNIFDRLKRFVGFTLLGFIFNNYANLLPRLVSIASFLKPAVEGFGYFAEGLLSSTIDWVEKGYRAYDTVSEWTKKLGGEDFNKLFTDFSGALNTFLNTAIIAGLVGIRAGSLKEVSLGSEAIKSSKSAFSGEVQIALKNRKKIFNTVSKRRKEILQRQRLQRVFRKRSVERQRVRRSQLQIENRARLDKLKEAAARRKEAQEQKLLEQAQKQVTKKPSIGDPSAFLTGEKESLKPSKTKTPTTPRKPPNTLRFSAIKYAEEKGGLYVDFGLPGKPSKRLPPEVAEGLRFMYENPKDRYTWQIVNKAFDKPEDYMENINEAYRSSRKAKFMGKRMVRPSSATKRGLDFAQRTGKQAAKQTLRRGTRLIPVIGPLLDIVVSVLSGDPIDEALVGAAGAALGSALGTAIVGAGTFGLGAIIGAGLGGLVGDIVARGLYDAAKKMFMQKGSVKSYAEGGTVLPNRSITPEKKSKKLQEPYPFPTNIGYFNKMLADVYGETDGENTVFLLQVVSSELKKIASFSGFLASLMGGSMDLLLGHPFDSELLRYIGTVYGPLTENAVKSAGDSVIRMMKSGFAQREKDAIQKEQQKTKQAQPQTPVLPSVSGSLIDTGYKDSQGRPIKLKGAAADAFIQMAADAKKQGVDIGPGVSNAFRTPEHNAAVGGAGSSRHMEGLAFDINWYSNAGKWIRENAPGYGFRFNDYSGTSTHFDYVGGGAKIKPAPTPSTPELGPQSSTKKDDAQKVATLTQYEVESNNVLMIKTLIQPMMVG